MLFTDTLKFIHSNHIIASRDKYIISNAILTYEHNHKCYLTHQSARFVINAINLCNIWSFLSIWSIFFELTGLDANNNSFIFMLNILLHFSNLAFGVNRKLITWIITCYYLFNDKILLSGMSLVIIVCHLGSSQRKSACHLERSWCIFTCHRERSQREKKLYLELSRQHFEQKQIRNRNRRSDDTF